MKRLFPYDPPAGGGQKMLLGSDYFRDHNMSTMHPALDTKGGGTGVCCSTPPPPHVHPPPPGTTVPPQTRGGVGGCHQMTVPPQTRGVGGDCHQMTVPPHPDGRRTPHSRNRNSSINPPPKSANKSADQFFSKTGSQCPTAQSQAPNTPSLWLLCSWRHVETQNISQFSKKFSSLSLHMVPEEWYGSAQRWSGGKCSAKQIGQVQKSNKSAEQIGEVG